MCMWMSAVTAWCRVRAAGSFQDGTSHFEEARRANLRAIELLTVLHETQKSQDPAKKQLVLDLTVRFVENGNVQETLYFLAVLGQLPIRLKAHLEK